MQEKVVESKICKHCGVSFEITDKDLEFYEKVSPIFNGVKYKIPSPTLCPDCRQQRRLSFHNERSLYKRKCDITNNEIISAYAPGNFTVYENEFWWSDKWDPMYYSKDFDFNKNFFEQFLDLSQKVPKQALIVQEQENSNYLNFAYKIKNCYLIFASSEDENCYYGNRINQSKNCINCLLVKQCENCSECIGAFKCYLCFYSQNISNCSESSFLFDCEGCKNCFMCSDLKNKQFCIKNIQYSKFGYFEEIKKYENKTFLDRLSEYNRFKISIPKKYANIQSSINCTGDNILNAKNIKQVFDGELLEDVRYSNFVDDVKDSMDLNYGYGNTVLNYDSLGTGINAYNIYFCINTWPNVKSLFYCDTCVGCSNLFGCVGLKNKSYCILNKQYIKEEYEELVPKIIEHMKKTGEWGEFFPSSISPFGYNETVANEYFPVSPHPDLLPLGEGVKGIIQNNQFIPLPLGEVRGGQQIFNRSTYEAPFPKVDKIILASKLPNNIKDIPDDILNRAIECEITKKPFKIIRQELDFYRKHNLPIPKRHPDQRHLDRMTLRNPRKLFDRKCDKCEKDIKTTYSPDRKEIVYCESCYNNSVY